MKVKVEEALNLVRPALQADGGDVELVVITSYSIHYTKLYDPCGV